MTAGRRIDYNPLENMTAIATTKTTRCHMPRHVFIYMTIAVSLLAVFACGVPSRAGDIALTKTSTLRFADVRAAQQVLAAEDKFVRALSRFDLDSRLGKLDADRDEFRRFIAAQALPWEARQVEKLVKIAADIRAQLADLPLPLPDEILLIRTTGKEEGSAAYCRGDNAIVLPTAYVERRSAPQLKRTLIHELFHILSRNNPDLRKRLYAIVGFKRCPEVAYPASLRDRKITNPDAPTLEHYIEIDVDGTWTKTVPVLYASADRYDPAKGGPFFRYLQFRLMAVAEKNGRWAAVTRNGEPLLIDPKSNASFHHQIGKNTGYIIHPDEILADNFVHLVERSKDLPTPKIVEQMRTELSRPAPCRCRKR